jgi:FixJ family two-component response regulator
MVANSETKTVIVVDDEINIVELLVEILESAGYRAIGCPVWTEAMNAIGREEPDLVLLDLKMPTIDGPSMLEFIRKEGLDVPVIVVSGFVTGQVSEDLSKLGVSAFVNKPFRAAEILKQVAKAIEETKVAPKSMDVLYESKESGERSVIAPKPETNEVLAALKKLDTAEEPGLSHPPKAGSPASSPPDNEVLAALKRHDTPAGSEQAPADSPRATTGASPAPVAIPRTPVDTSRAPAIPSLPPSVTEPPQAPPTKSAQRPVESKSGNSEGTALANDLVGSPKSSQDDSPSVSVTGHRHHRPPPRRKKRLTKRNFLMFGSMFIICIAVAGFMAVMNFYANQIDVDALKKNTEKAITKQATDEILKQLKER